MEQTSLKAYTKYKEEFTGQRGLLIMILEQKQPLSYQQLAELSGLSINAVCGRMNELKRMEIIENCGTRLNEVSGVHNIVYRIKAK